MAQQVLDHEIPYNHNEWQTIDNTPGGGDNNGMNTRIALLEQSVKHIDESIAGVRDDFKDVRIEIKEMRGEFKLLRWNMVFLGAAVLGAVVSVVAISSSLLQSKIDQGITSGAEQLRLTSEKMEANIKAYKEESDRKIAEWHAETEKKIQASTYESKASQMAIEKTMGDIKIEITRDKNIKSEPPSSSRRRY